MFQKVILSPRPSRPPLTESAMKNKSRMVTGNKNARADVTKTAAPVYVPRTVVRAAAANRKPATGAEETAQKGAAGTLVAENVKTAFLRALPAAGGIGHAIKESGIEPCLLYYCLQNDEAFRREFDRTVNTKLELELIDRTLEGKPAGLFGFTLPALMPEKYDAKYDSPRDITPPVVVFEPARKADK